MALVIKLLAGLKYCTRNQSVVFNNNFLSPFFDIQKGVRQGDFFISHNVCSMIWIFGGNVANE